MNDNKLKIVTFFTNEIKMNIYLIIFTTITYIMNKKFSTTECRHGYLGQLSLIFIGSLIMAILNLISMIYLVAKKHFARTEFFLIWIVNILWLIANIGMSVNGFYTKQQCSRMDTLYIFILFSFMKNTIEILSIMFIPVDFTNR